MKIYRGYTAFADVLITDQSYRNFSIMGDDYVVLDFYLKTEIDFEKNDYCNAFGERFYLIEKPVPEMIKGILHYNIKLYNTYKQLEKVKVFLYDTARDLSKSEFSFTCSPSEIVRLIVDNMNAVQGNIWTVGNVIHGEVKTITVSNQSCLELLSSAASEWDTEWYVESHVINLAKRTYQDNPIKTLSIGTGLLSVQQEALGNTSITRLYALGGTKNLPSTYGSTRLKMDVPYLEVSEVDIVEDIVIFDDIYPHRLGTVSSVRQTSQGIFYFTDSGLNFNPNDYQIDGLAKHIIFQSGALVGYDFEVNYNAATGEFEIIQYTEPSGEVLPSATLAPSAGDKYIIYNIAMPQSYVTAAENELKEKAQAYFDKIKNDKLSFNIVLDETYFTANGLTLQPGEEIILKHEYIEALKNGLNIRITGFNRYLNQPHRYGSVKVSDTVYSNPISRIDRKIEEVENVIERTGISNPNYPRRNWRDLSETMNLLQKAFLNFSKGINPITIQTMQLIVGDESLQFRFVNNKTNPTAVDHSFIFDKQTGKFTTPSGIIQHMTLGITEIKSFHAADEYKYWDIAAYTSPILEHEKAYYLYLKCDKNGTTGIFLLSETAIGMEQVSGYYHFLVGILNSQQDNDRSFAPLYGFTEILPGRITTDKIVSTDGKTYFDLDNSVIGGKIRFVSTGGDEQDMGEWVETTEEALSIITSDNYLSASEKPSQRKEWETVYSERNGLISQATNFGITTEKDNYSNAFQALSTYLNGGTTWTSGVPLWINDASLSVDTAIIGTTYRQKWVDLYSAKAALTNAIQIKIDQLSTDKVNGIQMGDRNLLRNSNPNVTNNLYPTVALSLSDEGKKLIEGEQVTIIIKGELGAGKTNFGIFNSNDYVRMVDISPSSFVNGIATKTFNWKIYHPTYPASNTSVKIFAMPSSSANSTVEWVKLVRGNKVTTDWTSAPEDIEAEIEDVSTSVTNLNTYVDGAFKDGVIDASEAKAIEKYINIVNTEKAGLEANYNKLYVNTYLTGTPKTDLLNSKVTYFGSLDTLINSINTAIADGKTTSAEKATVDSKYASYKTALADFRTKIEAANQAIQNTLKSYSDEAKAKAEEADYLKQALKQDTEISGGLILSSILATRDANGVVRSYQSGNPESNPVAFAAGVENFGTPAEKKNVEICHDGSGKMGIFVIDSLGNIRIYDSSDPSVIRLLFSKYTLPLLQSLLDDNIYSGSVTNPESIGATSGTTILPNKITVTQSGAEIHFTGVVSISGYLAPGYASGKIQVTVRIVNETTGETIYSISDGRTLDYIYESSYYNTIGIDKIIYNADAGTYRVEISRICINVDDFSAGLLGQSTLSWSFIKDIRRFEFARNGFMAFYQNNHMYFSEAGGLDVRGAMNIPGLLATGRVSSTGSQDTNKIWGAKAATDNCSKNGTGVFRVPHKVLHSKITGIAIPTSSNYLIAQTGETAAYISGGTLYNGYVEFTITSRSSGANSDIGFNYYIYGNNY